MDWEDYIREHTSLFQPHHPKEFDGFSWNHMDRAVKEYPDELAEKAPVTQGGVPQIIWRTYKNIHLPPHWKEGFDSGRNVKGWTTIFMTDQDNHRFVQRHFPHLLDLYENFTYPIQRVDLIRILYLYKYGGLYADLDKVFLRDIHHFFEGGDVYLVRSPNVHSVYTNSIMASRPGAHFWKECIDTILEQRLPFYAYGQHLKVMNSTGPNMITEIAQRTESVISLFPGERFEACSVCQAHNDQCHSSLETGHYIRQIEGSSWIGMDTRLYLCFFCSWPQMVLVLVFLGILFYCHFFTF